MLRDLGLEPSLDADGKCGKSVVLVSHAALEKALVPLIENFGLHFDARARNLGIDHHGQGRTREISVQAKRCDGVRLRGLKLQNLKKVGGRVMKVLKTGLKPAILYGARCIGLPRKQVAMFRRASSACLPGSHKGCSTTLRLALQQAEPCHDLTMPPILEWACAVWDSTVDYNILMAAWKRQLPRVALATSLQLQLLMPCSEWVGRGPTMRASCHVMA